MTAAPIGLIFHRSQEMAAALLTVFLDDILQSLDEVMKIGKQWRVERHLTQIHDHLSSILDVSTQAENKYGHSLELQEWVRNLKEVTFRADQLLQELSTDDAIQQRKWKVIRLFRAIVRLTFPWRLRSELRDVAERLQQLISSDRIDFIRNISVEMREANEAAGAVPFTGRKNEKKSLTRYLLDDRMKRDLPVLVVNGERGSGKTALVQEVLLGSEVSQYYNAMIWVNASPPFDENRMAREIIASLTNENAPEEENVVKEQSLVRIRKLLDGRNKYLFILDDLLVHDSDAQRWLRFQNSLKGGNTGSKIIVTTPDLKQTLNPESPTITLDSMTPEESRELLLKTGSRGEVVDPEKLQIPKSSGKYYNDNPLLLRALGDYLSLQHDASDWSNILDRLRSNNYFVSYYLLYGGYPYGNLSPLVKRYNLLPPRIKRCFGLCSLFPSGHAIDRQNLAELWIALGYIKSSKDDHQQLEVIADNYFNRLLKEELFLVKKFDTFENASSVVLHPDVEDLAHSVSGWECRDVTWNDLFLYRKKPPHISILGDRDITEYLIRVPHLEEFYSTRVQTVLHFVDDASQCEEILSTGYDYLKNIRVLDLHHMVVEIVPEVVWKLKLLRYLDLSDSRRIETLPSKITSLLNLQMLKLSRCSALKELPHDMGKMVALRHLYIDGCWKLSFMPKGLGDLQFLSILTDFILPPDDSISFDSANLADLCKLNDLRGSLRITNLGYYDATREGFKIQGLLDKKSSLESLELIFRNLSTDNSEELLEKLQPHPNLKGLKIHKYGGVILPDWLHRPLYHMPNLVEVALSGCENLNEEYFTQFDMLRHLKSLSIQGLPELVRMVSAGSEQTLPDDGDNAQPFGKLSSLCIRDCPKLVGLPRIPHLTKLTLVNVSEQLFVHPFCGSSSMKTLRLENIELLKHFPKEFLPDPTCLEELHIRSCPKLNCVSMVMPRLMKLTLENVSDELFMQPCNLPCLKTLRLENIEFLQHLPWNWLQEVTSLKELHIGSCPSLVSPSQGMMFLKNLVSLSIWNCKELDLSKDEHMTEVQGLKSLEFLTIYKASKMEYLPEWVSRVHTLKFLCLRSCPNLLELPDWIITLPWLKLIELVHCPKLRSLPERMSEFTDDYTRELSIICCPLLKTEGIKHSHKL